MLLIGNSISQFNSMRFETIAEAISFIKSLGCSFYEMRVVFTEKLEDFKFEVFYFEEISYEK